MKTLLVTAAVSVVLLLQGCETTASITAPMTSAIKNIGKYETGVYVSDATMSALVDHKSTQADVIGAVGRTGDRQLLGNREVWSYGYTKIASFGGNVSETTVFEFDRRGVLLAHYKTHGNAGSGNALTKAAGM
jgi:outer membrane protein assembly factor BamE